MHKNIFVSSTFRDFQTERDLLQSRVEQRTNELLENIQVSFLDLRWGIDTTGETNLEKVVSICIEEVLNSHPFYIIMLGDSYGSCVDRTVVRSLYALNGLSYDGGEKSVTQIEIEATGLFKGNSKYVLVLDRRTGQKPDPRAAALKQRVLEAALPENIYTYSADLSEGSVTLDDPDALIEFISSRLHHFLKDQSDLQEPHPIALARERAKQFCGRKEVLRSLHSAVTRHRDEPFFRIYAPQGSGLSTILAKLFMQLQEEGAQAVFLTSESELPATFPMVRRDIASQLKLPSSTIGKLFSELEKEKRYFCILDGMDEIGDDPLLRRLVRKGQIPENFLFILGTNRADNAHFTLPHPTKEDALELFEGTLQAYHKELPHRFRDYFHGHIPQEMVHQPALLKLFLSSLCYLTEEDYRNLGKHADFMEDLAGLFIRKLDRFPRSEQAYIRSAFLDAPDSQLWLLGLLSVLPGGAKAKFLLGILQSGDIECSLLQLRTVKERFSDSIHCSADGIYTMTRDSFRAAVQNCFTPEQLRYLRYLHIAYYGQNLAQMTLPQIFPAIVHQYLMLEEYELLARLLEANYFMHEHGTANGIHLSLATGDWGADAPSRHLLALAAEKNPYCNCWLVRYAMPYMTDLYRQNSTELFAQMYETVHSSGIDSNWAADLVSLQFHGLVLGLRFEEAGNLAAGSLSHTVATTTEFIGRYLSACLNYDSEGAASVIDRMLRQTEHTLAGQGEMLHEVLRITERMDGNALQYRPQLEKLFARCEAFLLSEYCRDASAIAFPLLSLSYFLRIRPKNLSAVWDTLSGTNTLDHNLSTNLTALWLMHCVDEQSGEENFRELVQLLRVTLEDRVPLGTVDLLYVCAYFRKVCYASPNAFSPEEAAEFAGYLLKCLQDIRGGVHCLMQTVEMIYLGCILCLYAGKEACTQQMAAVLSSPKVKNGMLLQELDFFRTDAENLIQSLGEDAVRALDSLKEDWTAR